MGARLDLSGQRFGALTVGPFLGCIAKNTGHWACLCDCGALRVARTGDLRQGYIRGCADCGRLNKIRAAAKANTLPNGLAAFRLLVTSYKCDAKKRGRTFDLSDAFCRRLFTSPCAYCGEPPNQVARRASTRTKAPHFGIGGGASFLYNGIDRVNNARGYEPGNVVACCKTCNVAKNDQPLAVFLAWAQRVAAYQNKQACAA